MLNTQQVPSLKIGCASIFTIKLSWSYIEEDDAEGGRLQMNRAGGIFFFTCPYTPNPFDQLCMTKNTNGLRQLLIYLNKLVWIEIDSNKVDFYSRDFISFQHLIVFHSDPKVMIKCYISRSCLISWLVGRLHLHIYSIKCNTWLIRSAFLWLAALSLLLVQVWPFVSPLAFCLFSFVSSILLCASLSSFPFRISLF